MYTLISISGSDYNLPDYAILPQRQLPSLNTRGQRLDLLFNSARLMVRLLEANFFDEQACDRLSFRCGDVEQRYQLRLIKLTLSNRE